MTVTAAAADSIREFLRRSAIPHPVVYLAQVSETLKGPRYLYPLVYPRSHFLWLVTKINGLPFAPGFFHPRSARPAMKRGVLDVAERGLVLRDADGMVVLPKRATNAP